MKNISKKNQIIITSLAIMIAVAGYLNYAGKNLEEEITPAASENVESEIGMLDISDEDIQAAASSEEDTQVVSSVASNEEEAQETAADAENLTEVESYDVDLTNNQTETPGEAVLTSAVNVGTVAQAKLTREQTRAKNKETLLEVINNAEISETQKKDAIQKMIDMTDIAEKEAAAEILLEAKGFTDVVVSISDNTADVVVNLSEISDAQRAQIEDIMKRKTGVPAENIVITPMHN